jgi:alpha-glucosidase (family GH31 glycosyl hydrolase)
LKLRRFFSLFLLTACAAFTARGQIFLGNYSASSFDNGAALIHADSASLRFVFYAPDVVRVDFLPLPSTVFDSSLVVVQQPETNPGVNFSQNDSTVVITSTQMKIVCRKFPVRVSYYDAGGKLLLAEPSAGGIASNGAERAASFSINSDDHFYGMGERGIGIDLRGAAFSTYNTQSGGYSSPLSTMNLNVPFVISTHGYALYFEDIYPATVDLGKSNPSVFSYSAENGELSYFFFASPTVQTALLNYTWLTGRQPLPPRWAFGFIQSKYGYRNETDAQTMIQTMRQKQIPCDAIILDLYWYSKMGDLSWNLSSWPDPHTMMTNFLSQGFKTILITEPYITQQSLNFSEAAANGYLGKDANGQPYLLSNWWSCGCNAGLLDITDSSARAWWWSKHVSFLGSEAAGLWTDLGEPERHPDDMMHHLGTARKIHNIYDFLWAQTVFDGFNQLRPNQRVFNLTRSGYAGIQRFGVIPWSGDVAKQFGGLAVQIPMMLNVGMSGLGYHNSDIGGFNSGTETAELYVRWMEYGTFCPITRAHGVDSPVGTEPWALGSVAETISKKFIQLRYRLLPYIYTMAYQNYSTGMPLGRPLFFDDTSDPNLVNESSSYLWGDAFLVSPVVQSGQTTKSVYLPKGKWIDFWSDKIFTGGQTVSVDAPLEKLPLFVKAGSIVPMMQVMNYSDEHPVDTLTLATYPSPDSAAQFTLYEDDGKTLAYQSGNFATTEFSANVTGTNSTASVTMAIGAVHGTFDGMLSHRVYISEIHLLQSSPAAVLVNGATIPDWTSTWTAGDSSHDGQSGFVYDDSLHIVRVYLPAATESTYEITVERVKLTSANEEEMQPSDFWLGQNYPNPFNPTTHIRFGVPVSGFVTLKVYDTLGRYVATLMNEEKSPGAYEVQFDASSMPSGVYFYRLEVTKDFFGAGSFVETKKLTMLK